MADFSKIIADKANSAKYMAEEIKHICTKLPKRTPGEEGERLACEYMAEVLKKDGGCERADVESFKENPGSFFGWIYITITCVILAAALYYFLPILGFALIAFGFFIMILQFGMYKKAIDFLFPEKTGTNVTAIKKCTGEVKGRVFFNGHPDAAWNWPVNNRFGGKVYEANIVIVFLSALFLMAISLANAIMNGFGGFILTPDNGLMFWLGIATLVFLPFWVGMYRMWDPKTTVDGANDNLSACYMGIALLKAMKDEGIELEHTEVGVILSGSEEAGLRGAKAWCEAHQGEFDDVPTWIYSMDTIHEPKFLGVNYRDLNGTVKADKEVSDSFMDAAKELNIHCIKTLVPPFGGATDSAAFVQAGFKATGVTALNHVLEDYYHTLRDSYDNLNEECLADCFAICAKALENFDKKISK